MTEQEKKELLDELEKRMDEKYKGCLTREDVATTLKTSEILLMMFRSANRDYRKTARKLEEMKNAQSSMD